MRERSWNVRLSWPRMASPSSGWTGVFVLRRSDFSGVLLRRIALLLRRISLLRRSYICRG